MQPLSKRNKVETQCERILYALVFILVFEGLLRKMLPPLSMPIFFLKDLLCIASIFVIGQIKLAPYTAKLHNKWSNIFFLFIPVLLATGFKDPILSVFGCKQYLLYVVAGLLMTVAFPTYKEEAFKKFLFAVSLLLIPTVVVAVLQNALPPSHWLNTSVGGESLEAFSAAGYLRVGSTFSFTAQYSWFLNAEAFFLAASFFMPPALTSGLGKKIKPFIYIILPLVLAVSAFITGGRTAVVGCAGVYAVGLALVGIRRPKWVLSKGIPIVILLIVGLSVLKTLKPQLFMAYDERAADSEGVSHNTMLANRIAEGFTSWTSWFWEQDAISTLIGNGLGVMSNGASQLSSYAAQIRDVGFWTEGDVATTFWEGGLYLAVIWYSFRISMIILCYRLWRSIKDETLVSAGAMPLAYIIIHGFVAQLGMQPPLSIWWWLAIGVVVVLHNLDRAKLANLLSIKRQKYEEEYSIR